jgi:integrase
MSALEQFMKAARRSNNSMLGAEWMDPTTFDSVLSQCCRGRPDSSKRSVQSLLKAWRESALNIFDESQARDERDFESILREALQAYQRKHQLSWNEVARLCSINPTSLSRFNRGLCSFYNKTFKVSLTALESILELPKGTLTRAKERETVPEKHSPVIPYRKNLGSLIKSPYRLPDPPPLLQIHEEFVALRDFKTSEIVLPGMQRSDRWIVRPITDAYTKIPSWASRLDDRRFCPTADMVWNALISFFGWTALEPGRGGKGVPMERISLAFVTDIELIREFFDFHKTRRNGEYSSIFVKMLIDISSFVRPSTGYIRQHPEFALRLRIPVSSANWDEWCDIAWRELRKMSKTLARESHKRRDPEEPIKLILARQHPLAALDEMLQNMRRKIPQTQFKKAVFVRNHLLIRLLCVVPLRARNLASLTYRSDNTGHIQHTDKGWRLAIRGREFKNYRHTARTDFNITLPDDLGKEIAEYVESWRPILLARSEGDCSDILFIHSRAKKFPTVSLSLLVLELTKKYCPDTPGFSPHAFRHIVATEYLKNNPNGYQVVAYILHDNLETVLKEYGHVTTSDGFAHWTKYLEDSALMSRGKDKKPRK